MRRVIGRGITTLPLLATASSVPVAGHAQPNPAQTLVGQQATACTADVRFILPDRIG